MYYIREKKLLEQILNFIRMLNSIRKNQREMLAIKNRVTEVRKVPLTGLLIDLRE